MKRYMANEYHRGQAQKRGGGKVIPMSVATADSELTIEAIDDKDNPEAAFDRHWAMSLLESMMHRLRDSYRADIDRFEVLKSCLLPGQSSPGYRELGEELGMNEGAVKVAIHRMRKRYGRLLRQEVADTLSDPKDVDQELRLLLQALAR
jgi:DNA-binding transcriptional regulator PaaX